MTSDSDFTHDDDKNRRPTTRHFDIVHSEEDDDEKLQHPPDPSPPAATTTTQTEAIEDKSLAKLNEDWNALDADLRQFEPKHKEYVVKLDEVESLKAKYRAEFDKYKKKLDQLHREVVQLTKTYAKNPPSAPASLKTSHSSASLDARSSSDESMPHVNSSPALDKAVDQQSALDRLNYISEQVTSNSLYLSRVADTLPRKDPYLKVILGGVDVSILNKADKWTYKQEYEKFKFIVTCISFVSSLVIWSLTARFRAFDAMFHFLLVWYYCTLTIRESILIANGSNINPWWRAHHFIATVATGILLTWPESRSYHAFRTQFFVFSFYLSFVQLLQFYYQRGCLYRLRALGETHDMEITIEGFQRWMFRGLSFLVPFLLVGYLFQLYNAFTLWQLAHVSTTHEWQVMVLAIIFFVLFLGNILTTLSVLREKLREKTPPSLLKQRYQSLKTFLSTNYHRRSRSFHKISQRQDKDD